MKTSILFGRKLSKLWAVIQNILSALMPLALLQLKMVLNVWFVVQVGFYSPTVILKTIEWEDVGGRLILFNESV